MTTRTNKRGNQVTDSRLENGSRYYFDSEMCTSEKGWGQFDTKQDAWYFGIWVNLEERKIITYAEGDVTTVECPTEESLKAELEAMEAAYGPPPCAAVSYDEDWRRTEYYDERPRVE